MDHQRYECRRRWAGRTAELARRTQAVDVAVSAVVLALATATSAVAPADDVTLLAVALFLLGIGWDLSFVAGSTC